MARLDVVIRPERPGDELDVRSLNEQAFGGPAEARLVDALRGTDGSMSLVATAGGAVVGHILFTPVTIEPSGSVRAAGLAPMSVLLEYQRKGIGSLLVEAGLGACRNAGYAAVVVVGHPTFYPRFGFVPGHTKGMTCEFPVPPDVFMVVEFTAGVLAASPGLVRYRSEFSEV